MPPKPKVKTGGKPEDVWKRDKGKGAAEEEEDEQGWSDEDNNGKKGSKRKDKKKANAPAPPAPEPVVVASKPSKSKKGEPAAPPPVHIQRKLDAAAAAAPPAPTAASKKKEEVYEPKPTKAHSAPVAAAAPVAVTLAASSHDKTSVCRLKLEGHTFEALCISSQIRDFRDGKCALQQVLADQDAVYRNASRGERYSAKELESAFGSSNVLEALERIVTKGQAQVTAEEMKEDVERKRREIVAYLSSKYVDPKTGYPHPPARIESALDTFKGLVFDTRRSAHDQATELAKKIISSGVLPMRKLEMEGEVVVAKNLQQVTTQALQKLGVSLHNTVFSADAVKISVGINPNDLDLMNKELARVTNGEFTFDLPDHAAFGRKRQ